MATEQAVPSKQNVLDMFVNGARRGFTIATTNMMPNVIMAFVIIRALNVTGLLDLLGKVFAPIMALWGLPGQAAAVLLAAFMSMGGGVGVAAGLYTAETLSAADITVLMPAIYLMGSLIQYLGRCLGTAEVNTRYYPHIMAISILNALLSMWVMRAILIFF
jgi:spore maturation protein SpmB